MASAPDDVIQRILSQGDQQPGLLGMLNKATAPYGGAGNLGLQLLANSGYSTTPRTFGQILGQSALNASQVEAGKHEQELKQQLLMAQLKALQAKPAVNPVVVNGKLVDPASGKVIYSGGANVGTLNPEQYTPESFAAFDKSGGTDYSLLKRYEKPEQPMDELAKLTADLKAGRISAADYKARREIMTTRPASMYADVGANDPKVEAAAKLIARYDQAPLTSMALRTPFGQAVTQRVLELNPEYHGEEFPKRQAAYKAFASGKQGDQVRSFNVGISHLNTVAELADALGNGDTPALNRISQAIAEATGGAAPTNLETAKEVVKAEIVKAVSGAGGGAGDRERALAGIDKAASPAQLKGAIGVAQKLMGGQLGGLRRQYEQSTGRKDFESLLSPDAAPYLATKEGMGDEGAGSKRAVPNTNSKGWTLHTDKNGNHAYVSPDGKQYEEVK